MRWCELNPSSEIQVCELFSCDLDCWVSRARHNCHVSPRYQHYFTLHCTLPWRGRQPRSSSLWRILRSAPRSEVTSGSLIRSFPDCDFYFDYYTSSSVRSLADCKRLCVASCRCQHYSYNYNQSSPFYHHCYLSYHCADPQPATDWISGPKVRGQT